MERSESLSIRERGLKYSEFGVSVEMLESLSIRERGLKYLLCFF